MRRVIIAVSALCFASVAAAAQQTLAWSNIVEQITVSAPATGSAPYSGAAEWQAAYLEFITYGYFPAPGMTIFFW